MTDLFDVLIENTYSVERKRSSTAFNFTNIAIDKLPTAWMGSLVNSIIYFVTMDNSISNSRSHIQAHYDLSNDLFRTFLDHETMMYSCALFEERYNPLTKKLELFGSLADAQERKIHALLSRLRLTKSSCLLDIGFGWGGIAIAAASTYGCKVHGITLSEQQKCLAEERVRAKGLQDLITFEIVDYRVFARSGRTFDRIVSCEMIEAVGHKYLPSFFDAIDRLLSLDGIFVMQAITMPDSRYPLYKKSADFLNTVIFPGDLYITQPSFLKLCTVTSFLFSCKGGCCPSLGSLISAMASESSLFLDSAKNINLHYAHTLKVICFL